MKEEKNSLSLSTPRIIDTSIAATRRISELINTHCLLVTVTHDLCLALAYTASPASGALGHLTTSTPTTPQIVR